MKAKNLLILIFLLCSTAYGAKYFTDLIIEGDLDVTGDANVTTNLDVDGTGNFQGILTAQDDVLVGDLLDVTGNAIVDGSMSVGKGSAADASAVLDLVSTSQGMAPPRMTAAQRDAIGSPLTGLIIYNTDDDALNIYDGTTWSEVSGSGGGGISNAEYNFLVASGVNNRFEKDVLGWTGSTTAPVLETTTEIEGEGSLSWTPAGAETLRSDAVLIPAWAYGTNCYAEIYYSLGGTEYSLKVLDGSNTEITSSGGVTTSTGVFAALSGESAVAYRTFVCPTSGSVKLSLETSGAAAEINIDRAYIGQNFRLNNGLNQQVFSARVTDGSGTTTVSNESADFINGNCTNGSAGNYTCTFVSGFFNSVSPNCVAIGEDQQQLRVNATSATAVSIDTSNSSGTPADSDFTLMCQRGADNTVRKIYTPPTTAEITNSFSALVTDGSGTTTVSNENVNWIEGNCTNGSAGAYVCTFVSGFFNSVAPNCIATSETATRIPHIASVSSSSVTVNTYNTSASLSDATFYINCQRGVGDYSVKQSTAPLLVNSVVSPYAGVLNVVSAFVADGSSTTTISNETGDWISGVCSNGSAGNYTCTFVANTFSSTPSCFIQSYGSITRTNTITAISSSSVSIQLLTTAGTPTDQDFMISCIGPK